MRQACLQARDQPVGQEHVHAQRKQASNSDHWAFVKSDGLSYGVFPKAMIMVVISMARCCARPSVLCEGEPADRPAAVEVRDVMERYSSKEGCFSVRTALEHLAAHAAIPIAVLILPAIPIKQAWHAVHSYMASSNAMLWYIFACCSTCVGIKCNLLQLSSHSAAVECNPQQDRILNDRRKSAL